MIHTVTLVTHPNRLGVAEPLGYRFAVHLTSREEGDTPTVVDPANLPTVINAGWRDNIERALLDGADQQMTAHHALELAGLTVELATITGNTDYHPPT